ncbi:hypothetical protein [Hymenobacter chitinivorans]|uniref:Uncharacterized protein n=1 Tax=Hymenobacter chitinivorans DSM 11115 TaxID=1121954 RepID=A0A2M9AQW8_9BACT|nr:hypothetical protein [Hymenobacter chitinivorans]PJJ48095.1 hypothetical protein CLV45_4788 [Hymenobacter chitinivorans DSM 11115]
MNPFDYVFYRFARHYYKKDGRDAFTAQIVVSLLQSLWAIAIIYMILSATLPFVDRVQFLKASSKYFILISGPILYLNYRRYRNTYWELAGRWREKETEAQLLVRSLGLILFVLLPGIVLILVLQFFGNK